MAANSIAKLAVLITGDASPLRVATQQAAQSVQAFSSSLSGAAGASGSGGLLASLAGSAGFAGIAAAAAAATAAVVAFGRAGIATAANIEQLQIAFEVMTGSAQTATDLIADMRKLSKETPLEMSDVQQAGKTLLAMGENVSGIIDELKMLGDIAAGSGQPLNELAQVFGQVMQAGRLTGNELRQFNERGVPLLTELSKQMGVSKLAIREMVEAGQISSRDVVQAFEAMSGAGGRFANMMERQTDTLIGQWNKFKENLTIIASTVMAPIAEGLKRILLSFNDILDSSMAAMGMARSGAFKTSDKARTDALRDQEQAAKDAEKANAAAASAAKQHADEIAKRAESIAQSLRTPGEVMADKFRELASLADAGALSWETYQRGIRKAADEFSEASKRASEFKKASKLESIGALEMNTQGALSAVNAYRNEERQAAAAALAESKQQTAIQARIDQTLRDNKPVRFAVGKLG